MESQVGLLRRATASLRLLPNFIIIGAQRCGTSSLFYYLKQHPDFIAPKRKEIHFFDKSFNFSRGFGWYRSFFPLAIGRFENKLSFHSSYVTGEASPYYLFHPLAPSRIYNCLPDVKLIVLLRDPIERTFSSYRLQVRLGHEPLSFEDALDAEGKRLNGEEEKLMADPHYYSPNHQRYSYLARSVYAPQLEKWFQYFIRDRLLIIKSEDFFKNPSEVYREVLNYLNLKPWAPDEFKIFNGATSLDSMRGDTRKRLRDYFKPHNDRLEKLLNWQSSW